MKVFENLDKIKANAAKKHRKMSEKGQKIEGKYGKMKVEVINHPRTEGILSYDGRGFTSNEKKNEKNKK